MAIIRVEDEFYTTTSHAEAKMLIHNISEEEIAGVIAEGDFDYTDDGEEIYIKQTGKRKIAVVIIEGTTRIKTVYIVKKVKGK